VHHALLERCTEPDTHLVRIGRGSGLDNERSVAIEEQKAALRACAVCDDAHEPLQDDVEDKLARERLQALDEGDRVQAIRPGVRRRIQGVGLRLHLDRDQLGIPLSELF
jgi:hypothetical protein